MAAVVEYRLDAPSVANPDGSLPIDFPGASVVAGPGDTAMGHFDRAIDLAGTTAGTTALAGAPVAPNDRAFCVRIAFQANASLASRQNLVESTGVPFSVHLVPGSAANDIHVVTTVATKHHGWSGTSTRFSTPLQPGKWYVADLAFDADTLGVFVDGKLVSVHAFPNGTLDELQGDDLYVGSWVDGQRDRFDGKLAALQWHDEVPPEHLSQLDEARTSAEWFCSYKWEQVRNRVPMGPPQAAPAYDVDSGAWHQPCASALLMYHESVGAAFEMHGAILAYYQANRGQRRNLGYLVSDESVATRNDGRKSVFSRGAIYWSRQTGAIAVLGKIYLAYENLGESGTFGFPIQEASNVAAGLEQQFQGCRIYYRNGTDRVPMTMLPIQVYFFSDGLFVVGGTGAVLEEQALEAAVVGLPHGGVDADVGRDPGQDDVPDPARIQDQLEVRGAERSLARLVDDRLAWFRIEVGDDVPALFAAHQDAAARPRIADPGADLLRPPALVGRQVR